MNVGDYVRTKNGIIDEIVISYNGKCASPNCNKKHVSCRKNYYNEDEIVKSSPNIIDLIEVGDYVNGYPVFNIEFFEDGKFEIELSETYYVDKVEDIKSIVTKESFESMEYKVGD